MTVEEEEKFKDDMMEQAKKQEDPIKSGKSFATLNNFAGREAEHHRRLQEYGFPSEVPLDSMRYTPVVETETDASDPSWSSLLTK